MTELVNELLNIDKKEDQLEWMLLHESEMTGLDLLSIQKSEYISEELKYHVDETIEQMKILTEETSLDYSCTLREYNRAAKKYIASLNPLGRTFSMGESKSRPEVSDFDGTSEFAED